MTDMGTESTGNQPDLDEAEKAGHPQKPSDERETYPRDDSERSEGETAANLE